jgi:hypothetical protein
MQKLQHFSAFTTFQLAKIEMSSDALRVCLFLLEKSFYKHGVCTASLSEIADACFYSKSNHSLKIAIPSYLSELEKLEIIKIKKEKGVTNTYKLLNLEYAKIFTKSKSISEKVEKKEVKKVYKKPANPVQVQQVTQVHEEKQVQVQAHKVQTRPQFCDEIAAEWVAWRREQGLLKSFPIEEYAIHIQNAYPELPTQNYEFWMRKIFEHIKTDEKFWRSACDTPHELMSKCKGSIKILKIFVDLQKTKDKQNMLQSELKNTIKEDDPNYKVFCQEIPF